MSAVAKKLEDPRPLSRARGYATKVTEDGLRGEAALAALRKLIDDDPPALEAVIRVGLQEMLRVVHSSARSLAWGERKASLGVIDGEDESDHQARREIAGRAGRDDVSGVITHIQRNIRTLYDTPLPVTGKRLGSATAPDIRDAIEFYRKRAGTYQRNARWLELILNNTGKNKTVQESMSLDALRSLQHKTGAMPDEE